MRRAGAGARVAYAVPTPSSAFDPVLAAHSDYWPVLNSGTLRAKGQGYVEAAPALPTGGLYGVWLAGSVGRPVAIAVDGRRVNRIGYQESYPGQWVYFGHIRLPAGPAPVRLTRGNGSLHPGSGDARDPTPDLIGTILLQREDAGGTRMLVAPASQASSICRARVGYQWIEVLRPGAVGIDSAATPTT